MNGNRGWYTSPHQLFVVPVPRGWTLTHGSETLELLNPNRVLAIVVSYFRKTGNAAETDARVHLKRFLAGQDVQGRSKDLVSSPKRAMSAFSDRAGKSWTVMFASGKDGLLLATCTYDAAAKADAAEANDVLRRIKLGGD